MKNIFKIFTLLLLASVSTLVFNGCVKDAFDEPPGEVEVTLTPDHSVADIRALHQAGQFVKLAEDWTIGATVIADDQSGNYYKTIVIQDETGGIDLKINATGLFNDFPIGRKIYIKTKGLYVSDYNGQVQLGGGTYNDASGNPQLAGIEKALIDNFIQKGTRGQFRTPTVKSILDLTDADQSTLLQFNDVEFSDADAGLSYADGVNKFSVNHTVQDCNGNTILLRTSGYSEFANDILPSGNGTLVAIYSVFGTDRQLYIRNVADVSMEAERCGGGTGTAEEIPIGDVRAMFTGTAMNLSGNKKVKGVVISENTSGNLNAQNLFIEGADGKGIAVRFKAAHSFPLGESIEIKLNGVELSEYKGLMQLNNVALSAATSLGAGTLPTPTTLTVGALMADFENHESTLVKIENATLAGGGTYGGNVTIDDGDALTMYTATAASFAGDTYPDGTVAVTCIASEYNNPQAIIRGPSDVTGGGSTTYIINEGFNTGTVGSPITLTDWVDIAVVGTTKWVYKTNAGNGFAEARGYQSPDANVETWLISPPIDLSTPKKCSFQSAMAFWIHDGLTVYVSTNFDGTNVGTATWTPLSCTLAGSTDTNYAWVNSGNINIPGSGTARIAFKYTGDNTTNTTTYRIDAFKVSAQ